SFRRGAKDAVKVLICLIPFFITAAFLESYITHLMSQTYDKADNTGLPVWASILILASSLWLMVWYFVIWPLKLSKRGKVQMNDGIVARLNQPHA
ncbi:MAG TPA: hypothetical protein DCQ34_11225, partial [Chitinophagaceae bacterium]|nr:hypothetical protein [Chitinophagaceae bacterium]